MPSVGRMHRHSVSTFLVCSLSLALGCALARGAPRSPGQNKPSSEKAVEVVFDGGLQGGWQDYGWAPRDLGPGHPALIDFSRHGGWIVAKPKLAGRFGALLFQFKAPFDYGDFLEVRVDSSREDLFPRILVGPADRADLPDGWSQVRVPLARLNPDNLPFEQIVFRAQRSVGSDRVSLDKIGFVAEGGRGSGEASDGRPPLHASMSVDCLAKGQPISPMIYGIAYDARLDAKDQYLWELGASARRWGGNATSTYNWQLGNAWNTGNDWFFENVNLTNDPDFTYQRFLDANIGAGVRSALTVPTLGWVAKDTQAISFPLSTYGAERNHDPYKPEAGDGFTPEGTPLTPGPQSRVGVEMPPEAIGAWVAKIRDRDQKNKGRSVQMYILDNEPMLWNSTHRDLHPAPVSYDELLQRTLAYGHAVRAADPEAVIAGPALWGWPAYFYSAVDAETHYKINPDRLRHGDMPLLPWLLDKLHKHQLETGERILDVLDVHYYPMADRVGGHNGGTDSKTAALRLRSTRSLWDPTYLDESWIREKIQLIPRLQEWIDKYDPGLGISIGEYNFGAEDDMSGGLAQAEALGRFGQNGIRSAFYWTYPPKDSPAFWAFRAFRNFDGHGGRFLDSSFPAHAPEDTSAFASRDERGDHLVVVVLNLHPDVSVDASLDLSSCGKVAEQRAFSYSRADTGLSRNATSEGSGSTVGVVLPPYSITTLDVKLGGSGAEGQP